ncbi:MAG TPA: response regulator [Candidatus Tectomicrobia bacterium]
MEHAVPRDPSCAFPGQGAPASASLRLQMCALDPPVRILVIDDEQSFVRGLAHILRRDGYTVDTAENGTAGLAQLQAHHYDVLLCDLRMPSLNGPDLYALVLRQYAYLSQRVIFLTGDTLSTDSTVFLEKCAQPWLAKPCHAAAIRSAIQHVLHARAPHTTKMQAKEDVPPLPQAG